MGKNKQFVCKSATDGASVWLAVERMHACLMGVRDG